MKVSAMIRYIIVAVMICVTSCYGQHLKDAIDSDDTSRVSKILGIKSDKQEELVINTKTILKYPYKKLKNQVDKFKNYNQNIAINRKCIKKERKFYQPIHYALKVGSLRVAELLLKQTINSSCFSEFYKKYIIWLCWIKACKLGYPEIVSLLLKNNLIVHGFQKNEVDKKGYTLLMYACKNGHADIVKLLLKHNICVNTIVCDEHYHKDQFKSALSFACSKGHTNVVKLLLENPSINVHVEDDTGETPLTYACEKEDYEMVKLLLEHGALGVHSGLLYFQDNNPFKITLYKNNLKIVRLLIEHASSFSTEYISEDDNTERKSILNLMNTICSLQVSLDTEKAICHQSDMVSVIKYFITEQHSNRVMIISNLYPDAFKEVLKDSYFKRLYEQLGCSQEKYKKALTGGLSDIEIIAQH